MLGLYFVFRDALLVCALVLPRATRGDGRNHHRVLGSDILIKIRPTGHRRWLDVGWPCLGGPTSLESGEWPGLPKGGGGHTREDDDDVPPETGLLVHSAASYSVGTAKRIILHVVNG